MKDAAHCYITRVMLHQIPSLSVSFKFYVGGMTKNVYFILLEFHPYMKLKGMDSSFKTGPHSHLISNIYTYIIFVFLGGGGAQGGRA